MSRIKRGRLLKRVNGDVYLAPMTFDPSRPVTSGAPLRRCSNDTSICLPKNELGTVPMTAFTQQNLVQRNKVLENKAGARSATLFKPKGGQNTRESSFIQLQTFSSVTTTSDRYLVPTNTAITSSEIKSKSTSASESITNQHEKRTPHVICMYDVDQSNLPAHSPENADGNFEKITSKTQQQHLSRSDIITASDVNSMSCVEQQTDCEIEMEGRLSNDLCISTAASLDLPVSCRQLPPTRSAEWSLKNQVGAVASKGSSSSITQSPSSSSKAVYLESCNGSHCTTEAENDSSKAGDGDTIKTPPGSHKVSERDNTIIALARPPPPVSAATSLTEKGSFTLTFRKPKRRPRPRSIVTNPSPYPTSLPSTTSSPHPISPAVQASPTEVENVLDDNANEIRNLDEADINNNKDRKRKQKDRIDTGCSCDPIEGTLPKSLLSLNINTVKGKLSVEAMMVETGHQTTNGDLPETASEYPETGETEVTAASNVFEPDASFWHSDSTPDETPAAPVTSAHTHASKPEKSHDDPTPKHVHRSHKPRSQKSVNTETASEEGTTKEYSTGGSYSDTKSTESSVSKSQETTQPYPSSYPPNAYGSSYDYNNTQSEGPFLRTEKGAIRFHLPGRIQHKTTIKVAHFPTGDDKNVILNVKPETEEEETTEAIPHPCNANNQNFVVPPYSYNPYVYANNSPYSQANYYGGYYGYPPYYR